MADVEAEANVAAAAARPRPKRDNARWMAALPDERRLSDINIPGTHDSGAIARGLNRLSFFHLYSRQSRSIAQQLRAGVRVLDVRVQVTKNAEKSSKCFATPPPFSFDVVHGGVLAAINLNKYQSFDSLLQECADFVRANSTECVIMSLKLDNWKNFYNEEDAALVETRKRAIASLRELLNTHAELFATFANKPDDISEAMYIAQVPLGDVRGKLLFFNRIPELNEPGAPDNIPVVPFNVPDNPEGGLLPGSAIYVQDRYEDLPKSRHTEAKLELVNRAFDFKRENPECVVWSFASATRDKLLLVNVHHGLLKQFGALPAPSRRTELGWIFFDFAISSRFFYFVNGKPRYSIDVVSFVIDTNFEFSSFNDEFNMFNFL